MLQIEISYLLYCLLIHAYVGNSEEKPLGMDLVTRLAQAMDGFARELPVICKLRHLIFYKI